MISIILPVYNEAKILRTNILKLTKYMDNFEEKYEIIIADDGSTDNTNKIAKNLISEKIHYLHSAKRVGRGATLNKVMAKNAKGDIIIYMDADLATDLYHIQELVLKIKQGADICTGSRLIKNSKVSKRSFLRGFFSRSYNIFLKILFNGKINDHQCGFKAFRKSTVVQVLGKVEATHWFWDTELLIRAQKYGLKLSEIPVIWNDRDSSQSKVNLFSDVVHMGVAALSLRSKL